MSYNQTPEKFGSNTIISMNYSVSSMNNRFSIWQFKIRVNFQYSINGFSHDFYISFNSPLPKHILLKILK